jgi:hypothetical protein
MNISADSKVGNRRSEIQCRIPSNVPSELGAGPFCPPRPGTSCTESDPTRASPCRSSISNCRNLCERNRRRSFKYLEPYFTFSLPPNLTSPCHLAFLSSVFLDLVPILSHDGDNYCSWVPHNQGHPYICCGWRRIWRGLSQCQRRSLVCKTLPFKDCF